MNKRLAFVAVCISLVMGCNDRSDELKEQLAQAQKEQASAKQVLSERDKYIEEVMQSINDVYKEMEQARIKEGHLLKQMKETELSAQSASIDTRERILTDIRDIGSDLKENRKRIGALQVHMREQMKKFNLQIAGLDSLISNLKASLREREQSIAQLETSVQGLEVTVAEKTRTIQEKESLIDDQQKKLNTAFYVVGTRDELKKKGIIVNEGGFLWGLLGSTTVLAGDVNPTEFTAIDKTKDQTIHIQGRIDEILPRRNDNFFAMTQKDGGSSDLSIVSPDKFWQSDFLVIVVD